MMPAREFGRETENVVRFEHLSGFPHPTFCGYIPDVVEDFSSAFQMFSMLEAVQYRFFPV
jgi:hypothetical protein